MPTPLKPGETPHEIAKAIGAEYGWPPGVYSKIAAALKSYGDRRGEEERAAAFKKAADEARAACDRLGRSELSENQRICAVAAMAAFAVKLESLAAAPSGDTPGALEKLLSEGRALHDWLERKRDHLSSVGDVRGACVCAEALEEDFMRHIELRATPSGDAKGTK